MESDKFGSVVRDVPFLKTAAKCEVKSNWGDVMRCNQVYGKVHTICIIFFSWFIIDSTKFIQTISRLAKFEWWGIYRPPLNHRDKAP